LWERLFSDFGVFLRGFAGTVGSRLRLALTLVIASSSVFRCSGNRALSAHQPGYMSFFQNTPLVVQIFSFTTYCRD
jgi:ABC-type amino acid transport system permease subunit